MPNSEVDFVLTEKEFASKLDGFKHIYADCSICASAKSNREYSQRGDDLAYILYTSGTTGRPKGVCVTNRNVCHYVRAFENEFHPRQGDIMLQYSVCSFDIFVEEVFTSILNGAALAIPADEDKKNIRSLMAFVERHGVTMLSGFPYLSGFFQWRVLQTYSCSGSVLNWLRKKKAISSRWCLKNLLKSRS